MMQHFEHPSSHKKIKQMLWSTTLIVHAMLVYYVLQQILHTVALYTICVQ